MNEQIIIKCLFIFIYLFILFFTGTHLQARAHGFSHDGSNDTDSCNNVSFGGFVDTAPHLGITTTLKIEKSHDI